MRLIGNVAGTGVAIALAVLSGAHALSSASVRSSPELSVAAWPANGLALERVAYRSFVGDIRGTRSASRGSNPGSGSDPEIDAQVNLNSEQLQQSAAATAAAARTALRHEPLSPKAHTILALAEKDPLRQSRILALASQLNRRELALQGLVLQSRVNADNYPGTIETLDQILRVHPQRKVEFFPILTNALGQRGARQAFQELLARPLPWRDTFLMHAVRDPAAAANLAVIRGDVSFENPDFDRSLVARLAGNGDVETAAEIYRQLQGTASQDGRSQWASVYPPFDWTLADTPGLRAQLDKDERDLEITVDPGNGGILASRLFTLPLAPLTVTVRHQLEQGSSAEDLKLILTCYGESAPFFEATFAQARGRFDIERRPACTYVLLAISGRAWTGSNPLNGTINDVLIAQR